MSIPTFKTWQMLRLGPHLRLMGPYYAPMPASPAGLWSWQTEDNNFNTWSGIAIVRFNANAEGLLLPVEYTSTPSVGPLSGAIVRADREWAGKLSRIQAETIQWRFVRPLRDDDPEIPGADSGRDAGLCIATGLAEVPRHILLRALEMQVPPDGPPRDTRTSDLN